MIKPLILVTNDDGIDAPGIHHLIRALDGCGTLAVVAPSHEQSGVGVGITIQEPLHIEKVALGCDAWKVSGTPADCVKMALSVLHLKPDLIVSGINRGTNVGRNVLYSGTIGGVIDGVLRGIPGVAFSSFHYDAPEYAAFEPYVGAILRFVHANPLPIGTVLNVNFPHVGRGEPFGIKLTRQGKSYWVEDPSQHKENSYFLGGKLSNDVEAEDSDAAWLAKGYITAAPVHVDELTDWRYLRACRQQFEQIPLAPKTPNAV